MPNWCRTVLVIRGQLSDLERFRNEAVGFSSWDWAAGREPGWITIQVSVSKAAKEEGLKDAPTLRKPEGLLLKFHYASQDEGSLSYWIETAWIPPWKFIDDVSRHWPTLFFELSYIEEMQNFRGEANVRAGKWKKTHLELVPSGIKKRQNRGERVKRA